MFNIVVCMDEKMGIGKDGDLPWKIPEEMEWFKNLTSYTFSEDKQNAVIMGRKTWESIPEKYRPLPGRHNIVITRKAGSPECPDYGDADACGSLEFALEYTAKRPDIEQIFVIGGAEIYKEAVNHPDCHTIFASVLSDSYECDTFFPELPNHFLLLSTVSANSFVSKIIVNLNNSDLEEDD